MKDIPQISNAEWEVMRILWDKAPIKAAEVIKTLQDTKDWKPKTIKTLIRRLLDKGVIGHTTYGNAYVYHVVIEEKEYLDRETDSFLNKLYQGSIRHFMLNFVQEKELSREEVAELIKILENSKR